MRPDRDLWCPPTRRSGVRQPGGSCPPTGSMRCPLSSIQDLLDAGHGEAVVQLCEHALEALEDAMGRVDDSDGYMASIRDHLVTLHHDACVEALQDAEALARRLFDWELYSEWEIFFGAASTYEDVLG